VTKASNFEDDDAQGIFKNCFNGFEKEEVDDGRYISDEKRASKVNSVITEYGTVGTLIGEPF
jgi:hypothetical protein